VAAPAQAPEKEVKIISPAIMHCLRPRISLSFVARIMKPVMISVPVAEDSEPLTGICNEITGNNPACIFKILQLICDSYQSSTDDRDFDVDEKRREKDPAQISIKLDWELVNENIAREGCKPQPPAVQMDNILRSSTWGLTITIRMALASAS
jgi:hypothetical protein